MLSPTEIVLEYVCPTLGLVTAILMWLAPVRDLRSAVRRGAGLGDLNPTPWAFMLGNCLGWSSYGVLTSNWFVFWANYPGFLISCWLNLGAVKLIYAFHHTNETRRSLAEYLSSASSMVVAKEDRPNDEDRNERDARVRQPLSREIIDQDPAGTTSVEYGDGTSVDASPSSQSMEDPSADAAVAADAPDHTPAEHDQQHEPGDWVKIVWEVTSQTTPAKAPHDHLVVGMVIVWSLVLAGIGFFAAPGSGNADGPGQTVVGYVVNLNLIFFYGAPLTAIGRVLRSQRSDSLHVPTMMTNTSNATFWTAYAIAINDPFIYVPNGLGVVLGVIQLVLNVIFPKSARPTSAAVTTTVPSERSIRAYSDGKDTHNDDERASADVSDTETAPTTKSMTTMVASA